MSAQTEGVTKYRLTYRRSAPADASLCAALIAWRWILAQLGMVGQDPGRYHGLGFGNLSQRVESPGGFLITGTQTGALESLTADHFCLVSETDTDANTVSARGPVKPSSEALTHGTVYAARPDVEFVFHCHHPLIWHAGDRLGLPRTPTDIAYGTAAMASAMAAVLAPPAALPRLVVMGGHEDGLVAAGRTAEETGSLLVTTLARAMALP